MVWIKAHEKAEGMYAGQVYSFNPGDVLPIEDDAAAHILSKRAVRIDAVGVRTVVLERADGPAPEKSSEPVLCPICDKDFSEAAKPEYSLLQHIRAAHSPAKAEAPQDNVPKSLDVLAPKEKEAKPKKERYVLNPEE